MRSRDDSFFKASLLLGAALFAVKQKRNRKERKGGAKRRKNKLHQYGIAISIYRIGNQ